MEKEEEEDENDDDEEEYIVRLGHWVNKGSSLHFQYLVGRKVGKNSEQLDFIGQTITLTTIYI